LAGADTITSIKKVYVVVASNFPQDVVRVSLSARTVAKFRHPVGEKVRED
jgi:hypothetical protein